jgi:hypothetical protein
VTFPQGKPAEHPSLPQRPHKPSKIYTKAPDPDPRIKIFGSWVHNPGVGHGDITWQVSVSDDRVRVKKFRGPKAVAAFAFRREDLSALEAAIAASQVPGIRARCIRAIPILYPPGSIDVGAATNAVMIRMRYESAGPLPLHVRIEGANIKILAGAIEFFLNATPKGSAT